ncbi:MAG: hypothetical protein ACLSHC_11610 [Bilophila wadsworthia]
MRTRFKSLLARPDLCRRVLRQYRHRQQQPALVQNRSGSLRAPTGRSNT